MASHIAKLAVELTAVSGRLFPVEHPIIPDDAGDPQAIIIENPSPPSGLRRPMRFDAPPVFDRFLIAPE
jgi:hypothetical protein